jgi:hypothetical protein
MWRRSIRRRGAAASVQPVRFDEVFCPIRLHFIREKPQPIANPWVWRALTQTLPPDLERSSETEEDAMTRISTTTARTTRLQAISAALLVALIALTGAAWMTITVPDDAHPVVTLERVVIEGTRTPDVATVHKLPRVVIEGRRAMDEVQVAQTEVCVSC